MKTYLVFALAFMLLTQLSCKKDKDKPITEIPETLFEDNPLSDDIQDSLAALPDTLIALENIFLENGEDVRSFLEANDPQFLIDYPSGRPAEIEALSPYQQKLMFIARMIAMGNFLVDDSKHTYPDEGADSPAQTGLAFSWGSKDWVDRQAPPGASGGCKDVKVYGLDASGMLYNMTMLAGLPPVVPMQNFCVAQVNDTAKWTTAFKNSNDYKDLRMIDKGTLPNDEMENGDIILWSGPGGDFCGVFANGFVYQSNGNSNEPKCYDNISANKGPRCVPLLSILTWGLGSYKVFRASHSVTYKMVIKQEYGYAPYGGCAVNNYLDSSIVLFHIKPQESNWQKQLVVDAITNLPPTFTYENGAAGCECFSVTDMIGQAHIDSITGYQSTLAPMIMFTIYFKTAEPAYDSECSGNPYTEASVVTTETETLSYDIETGAVSDAVGNCSVYIEVIE